MTTRHRIITAVCVSLGFGLSAAPALAYQSDLTANGSEVPAGSPSVSSQPASAPTLVRVSATGGGFDWGDAGIGAGGVVALSVIGVGGALAASQQRGRHRTAQTS